MLKLMDKNIFTFRHSKNLPSLTYGTAYSYVQELETEYVSQYSYNYLFEYINALYPSQQFSVTWPWDVTSCLLG